MVKGMKKKAAARRVGMKKRAPAKAKATHQAKQVYQGSEFGDESDSSSDDSEALAEEQPMENATELLAENAGRLRTEFTALGMTPGDDVIRHLARAGLGSLDDAKYADDFAHDGAPIVLRRKCKEVCDDALLALEAKAHKALDLPKSVTSVLDCVRAKREFSAFARTGKLPPCLAGPSMGSAAKQVAFAAFMIGAVDSCKGHMDILGDLTALGDRGPLSLPELTTCAQIMQTVKARGASGSDEVVLAIAPFLGKVEIKTEAPGTAHKRRTNVSQVIVPGPLYSALKRKGLGKCIVCPFFKQGHCEKSEHECMYAHDLTLPAWNSPQVSKMLDESRPTAKAAAEGTTPQPA